MIKMLASNERNPRRFTAKRLGWRLALLVIFLAAGGGVLLARARAGLAVEVVTAQPVLAGQNTRGTLAAAVEETGAVVEETGEAGEPSGSAQARVDLSGSFYNFGRVNADETVRREFLITNRGQAPLVIQQAYTTCGCTTAEISARVIPPGKAARAVVIFDAGFHNSAGQTVRRGLVLETNDPEHPQVEIWVQARVE